MSNLFPSPHAFDFPQVFYHIKAAGLVYFSGVREGGIGGEGRTASMSSQRGISEKRPEGGEGCSSFSPCRAVRQGNRTGLRPTPEASKLPPSSAPAPQPWAHSGIMQLKESREKQAPPPPMSAGISFTTRLSISASPPGPAHPAQPWLGFLGSTAATNLKGCSTATAGLEGAFFFFFFSSFSLSLLFFFIFKNFFLVAKEATCRDYVEGLISRRSLSPHQVGEGTQIRLI